MCRFPGNKGVLLEDGVGKRRAAGGIWVRTLGRPPARQEALKRVAFAPTAMGAADESLAQV